MDGVQVEDRDEDDTGSVKSFTEKTQDEDTVSIFAGIGEDSKTTFQAGEVATEYSLYKKGTVL